MDNLLYCRDYSVGVWARPPIVEAVAKALTILPVEVIACNHAIDVIMIPYFALALDGRMLTVEAENIDALACYLTGFSGRMKQCQACKSLENCIKAGASDEIDPDPEYISPVIFLHSDKNESHVEGLIAQVPPMAVNDKFSEELEQWLVRTIAFYHEKVQAWRIEFEKWRERNNLYGCPRPETAKEIAERKWFKRNNTLSITFPDYD